MKCYFPCWIFSTYGLVLSHVRVQCPVWLFSVVCLFRAFLVFCSGIFWIILTWLQLPLLLLVCFEIVLVALIIIIIIIIIIIAVVDHNFNCVCSSFMWNVFTKWATLCFWTRLFIASNVTAIDTKSLMTLTCTAVFSQSVDKELYGYSSRTAERKIKGTLKYIIYFTVR